MSSQISFDDFLKVDLRVGRITAVEDFPEARKPAYKLTIDFGDGIGTKRSSAQIRDLYSKPDLLGRLIIAVVNFPPKQIGPYVSDVLVLGVHDNQGRVVLLDPGQGISIGERVS
jgi:tRNA-binding protein